MPLRSVEAATRDDAIAAAREQFGPSARVVGVRRVRSGGVLGFFATERYVAEVAPDAGRPAVPVPPSARVDDAPLADAAPADFSSPLASAAPARARTAPARNGASAWAAEAVRTTDVLDSFPRAAARTPEPARTAAPAWAAAPIHPATPAAKPVKDEERVSELAALLAAQQAEPPAPVYSRTSFPRAAAPRPAFADDVLPAPRGLDAVSTATDDDDDAPPSPFTAALARMVAGDRDVRQAVKEALEGPTEAPWPAGIGSIGTAEPAVPPVARQEEEPVAEQVFAPAPSMTEPVELPTWAAEPEVTPASGSPREEAIAEVLRAALAQGHSDEALTGILRKVLDGASPQTALTDPVLSGPEVVVEDVVEIVVPAEVPAVVEPAPVVEVPVVEPAAVEAVVAKPAVVEAPAVPVFESASPAPVFAGSVFEPAPAPAPVAPARPRPRFESMWGGTPAPTPLWGEPAPTSSAWTPLVGSPIWGEPTSAPVASDAPIWGEVAATETADDIFATAAPADRPAAEEVVVEEIVAEPVVAEDAVAEEIVAEEIVAESVEEVAAESAVEETVEEELAEAEIAEIAPLLARTASDPAPMMSLDSTTVMPPLSLLPPLPSARGRGRGRPPVPRSSRPAVPPSKPSSATPERTEVAETRPEATAPEAPETSAAVESQPAAPAPTWSLATVTRLPVAPLMAGPDIPELPEEAFDPDALFPPVTAPAAIEVPEAPAAPPAPATSGVAARLEQLGLSRDLLAGTFDDDITGLGVYAALTRSLALNLPPAPEVPRGPGETLFVVGPGVDALRAARSLAASLHLDPDRVQWATRGDLAGLAPSGSRITTVDTAIDRRQDALTAGSVTIVAIDAPLRTDAYWMTQMIAIWNPVAVWGVVEATRKPEDLEPWIAGLPQLDALIVQDTDLSADPAAVLRRVATPVAVVDGVRATPHRWASLLCERLENTQA